MDGGMQGCRVSRFIHQFWPTLALGKANQMSSVPSHLSYDIALLYLQQSKYDLDLAVEVYLADEKWEKEHPMEGSSQGKMNWKPGR